MINAKNIMSHEQKSVESSKNSFFLDEKNSEREWNYKLQRNTR
jgi:hypothetical protein